MAQPSSRLARAAAATLGFDALRWATLAAAAALSPLHGWAWLLSVAAGGLLGWWHAQRAAAQAV
jgi:hypothetical protein